MKTIILQAAAVMKIEADDSVFDGFAKTVTYALAQATKTFADAKLDVKIDAEHAVVSYMDDGKLASFTMKGAKLDDRHFRIAPDEEAGFGLELSTDKGLTFDKVGSFAARDVADDFGRAWVSGRAESDR